MKDFQSNLPWYSSKKKLLEENPNHHAYIFEGPKGLGKKIFTSKIAKGLLCSSLPNGTFCNQCQSCLLFDKDNHPDFHLIELEEKKKQISINQIRNLHEPLYESAFLGSNKVFVINPTEMMTREAFDAILKYLEEPPDNSFFILVSHRYHSLPLTIKSRCFQVNINLPNKDETKAWLMEGFSNNSNIDLAILLSKGKPLIAAKMANSDLEKLRENFIKEISELIKTGSNLIEISESWSKDPDEMLLKIEWMSDILMDCLRHKFFTGSTSIFEDTEIISSYLAKETDSENFFYLLQKTNTFWSLFNSSTNLRTDFQLKALFVDWTERVGLAR